MAQINQKQVWEQIKCLEDDIYEGVDAIGRERMFEISYEDLCNSPRDILKQFSQFYSDLTGFHLKKRFTVPGAFNLSKKHKLTTQEYLTLKKFIQVVENQKKIV